MSSEAAPGNAYSQLVASVRDAFNTGKTKSVPFRIQQLKNAEKMVNENEEAIAKALAKDLRKPKFESLVLEVECLRIEIAELMGNCARWAKDERLPMNLLSFLDTAYIRKEPYGVALVLGAWNYPFFLSLRPLLGAISAGNCVVVKPSEMAPHTAQLIADLVPKYLDRDCYRVVVAEVEGTKELLTNKFDYIFFTGAPTIGRAVMAAAAPNLTPVTLELGGKNPCYIDESADVEIAVRRILWGKCMNSGQTCIAPDYILCSKQTEKKFIEMARKVIHERYGDDLQGSADFARIVNERHWNRIHTLLRETRGNIVVGGGADGSDLWIEPTIVTDLSEDDALMKEEIFGPILPIFTVKSVDEAVTIINKRPKPLALYSFSKNDAVNKKLVEATSSGGVCINDTVFQAGWPGLPFGGVGDSGMGAYHGKHSFDTFSHRRSILHRSFSGISEKFLFARYPPYTLDKLGFLRGAMRKFAFFNVRGGSYFTHVLAALLGMGLSR